MQPETKKAYIPIEPREHSESCTWLTDKNAGFDILGCARCCELHIRVFVNTTR